MPPVTLDYQGHEAIAGFLRDINTWRGPRGYRLIPTRDDGQPAFGCGRNRKRVMRPAYSSAVPNAKTVASVIG